MRFIKWLEKHTATDLNYITKGGFWLGLGQAVSMVSGVVLAIAFSNFLPQETYGTYKYILSIASILALSSLPGINTSMVQAIARGYEGSIIPALCTRLKWSLIGSLSGVALAGYYFFHGNTSLTIAMLVVSTFLPFANSFDTYLSIFTGRKQFKVQTKFRVAFLIVSTILLIVSSWFTQNVLVIILVYFSSYSILHFLFLKIFITKFSATSEKISRIVIPYGKHLSFIGIITQVANHIDKILIWHWLGAAPVAIYSFAIFIPEGIKMFFKNLATLALPKFSQRLYSELENNLYKKFIWLIISIVPVIIIYVLFAPLIYRLLFSQYTESILYSQIFSLSLLFVPNILIVTALTSQTKKRELYIFRFISSISKIALFLLFLPYYKIWGVIYALLVSQVIDFVLLTFLFKRTWSRALSKDPEKPA